MFKVGPLSAAASANFQQARQYDVWKSLHGGDQADAHRKPDEAHDVVYSEPFHHFTAVAFDGFYAQAEF